MVKKNMMPCARMLLHQSTSVVPIFTALSSICYYLQTPLPSSTFCHFSASPRFLGELLLLTGIFFLLLLVSLAGGWGSRRGSWHGSWGFFTSNCVYMPRCLSLLAMGQKFICKICEEVCTSSSS
mmetsp:Transcript_27588/g.42946  ORF Transcript_27588/g.42946 Transcript_27588/m.42946 type:complete len:124 (-) Transcript_27588:2218-2589(-)